jgi:uncharacterized membrane protein
MNKITYLEQLKKSLSNLPKAYTDEILKDYENHFEEGILLGKPEEKIANDLGNLKVIASEIIAQYYTENSSELKSKNNISNILFLLSNAGIGALNMVVILPLVLSVSACVVCIYACDYMLLFMPIAFVLHLIFPSLSITIGTANGSILLQLIITVICVVSGYLLHKLLKTYTRNFFKWVAMYVVKSVKFQILPLKKDL